MTDKRTGLYPGTFDPITNGHLDIINRGFTLVDHMIIGVSTNPGKTPMFSLEERVDMVRREVKELPNTSNTTFDVQPFDELLVHFAKRMKASFIIRGLRAVADFEYEFQMTGMNYQIDSEIETVFLMADPKYQTIASRLVKEVAKYGGDISPFVPLDVRNEVLTKIG